MISEEEAKNECEWCKVVFRERERERERDFNGYLIFYFLWKFYLFIICLFVVATSRAGSNSSFSPSFFSFYFFFRKNSFFVLYFGRILTLVSTFFWAPILIFKFWKSFFHAVWSVTLDVNITNEIINKYLKITKIFNL